MRHLPQLKKTSFWEAGVKAGHLSEWTISWSRRQNKKSTKRLQKINSILHLEVSHSKSIPWCLCNTVGCTNWKGNSLDFTHEKKLSSVFSGSRGSCVKPDELSQAMSLESASAECEDYKFENKKKIWGCGVRKRWTLPDPYSLLLVSAWDQGLETTLVTWVPSFDKEDIDISVSAAWILYFFFSCPW